MGYATPLLNGIQPPGNSFVLPRHKIVYISVTKAACTSMRWMMAGLSGEDFESFYRTPIGHQTRLMTVHNRRRWQQTPQLQDLSEHELAEISRDRGWFIFAVVRDPWSRLWSAWQSKFLVRHTPYVEQYLDEPWFPRIPETAQEVVDDFHRFVAARPWETHPVLSRDRHFLPQVVSVKPGCINYSRIYDVREMSTLLQDLRTHIEALGLPADMYTPRANVTPLALTSEVLGEGVPEVVADAYRADFEAFGEYWALDQLKLADDGWSPDAIRLVQYHTAANQRIGDLSAEARRLRSELRAAQQRLHAAQPADRTETSPAAPQQANQRKLARVPGRRAHRAL